MRPWGHVRRVTLFTTQMQGTQKVRDGERGKGQRTGAAIGAFRTEKRPRTEEEEGRDG